MRIKKLLFFIPIIAFLSVFLFLFAGFVPNTAVADVTPSLDLLSFERQYGDFVLDKTKWSYLSDEDVFISFGNVSEGKYVPMNRENNGDYQYECRLNLLVEDENGEIMPSIGQGKLSKPYDSEGNCILSPSPTGDNGGRTYRLYQGSFKNGTKDVPFAKLFATEKGKAEGLSDYTLRNYSSDSSITVKKRKINVGVRLDSIPENVQYSLNEKTENLKTVKELNLSRTFSLETKLALEDVESRLVFGQTLNDFLTSNRSGNGMYAYDNVGEYSAFTFGNDNVRIVDKDGNDMNDFYEIASDFIVKVSVVKLKILAPVYNFESVYLQNCIDANDVTLLGEEAIISKSDYNLINFIDSSIRAEFKNSEDKLHYFDHNDVLLTNNNLSVDFSYSIKTNKNFFTPEWSGNVGLYSLYVNGSEYNPNQAYECIPVLINVDGYDKTENFDNTDNFELICSESDYSYFKIKKRTIILYAEGAEEQYPSLTPDPSSGVYCIPVSTQNFSKQYGFAYNENNYDDISFDTLGDGIIDTRMEVTFKIGNFESYLDNPNFYSFENSVILNVGKYSIVPEINDWRYNATIHESLHYTVTPKELTLNELYENNDFVSKVEYTDGKYVIAGYNYECDSSVYSLVDLKFSQKIDYPQEDGGTVEKIYEYAIKFSFSPQTVPGVYSSSGLCSSENDNFVLTDLVYGEDNTEVQNVAIRIFNKLLTASIGNIEYDGTTPEAIIEGKSDEFDYEVINSYCKGTTYNEKNALKNPPVNAGTYTVRIKLKESNIYAFEGGRDYIDLVFEITKRKIVVTVTAKGDKTFGTKGYFNSPSDSNIATYTVEYNGEDKTKPALINGDKLGNLSSKASEITAKPKAYEISTADLKNENYEITFLNSGGYPKAESINVVKLSKEIPELTSFAKGNACVKKVDGQSINLGVPTLFGVKMTPFEVSYSQNGGEFVKNNVNIKGEFVEITNLSEGTKYTIRYTISRKNDYLALSKDVIVEIEVATKLTVPEVEQNIEKTTDTQIFVNLYNYQDPETNGYYFAYIENDSMFAEPFRFDIPGEFISFVEEKDENGIVTRVYALLDINGAIKFAQGDEIEFYLEPETEYVLYVLREKDFTLDKNDQSPLTVLTAPSKPDIKKSDIILGENTIYLNPESINEEDVYVIEYILGDSKTTITSIIDNDVDLTPVFQKEDAEIYIAEGTFINETFADRIYYLKIYKEKYGEVNGEEIAVKGEPIYFEIHTPEAEGGLPSALLKVSGYLGVGTMAVLLIALIIFTILYSKLRRKWRIK